MKLENIKKEIRELRIREMAWTINEIDMRMAKLEGMKVITPTYQKAVEIGLQAYLNAYIEGENGDQESKGTKAGSP